MYSSARSDLNDYVYNSQTQTIDKDAWNSGSHRTTYTLGCMWTSGYINTPRWLLLSRFLNTIIQIVHMNMMEATVVDKLVTVRGDHWWCDHIMWVTR